MSALKMNKVSTLRSEAVVPVVYHCTLSDKKGKEVLLTRLSSAFNQTTVIQEGERQLVVMLAGGHGLNATVYETEPDGPAVQKVSCSVTYEEGTGKKLFTSEQVVEAVNAEISRFVLSLRLDEKAAQAMVEKVKIV